MGFGDTNRRYRSNFSTTTVSPRVREKNGCRPIQNSREPFLGHWYGYDVAKTDVKLQEDSGLFHVVEKYPARLRSPPPI